MAQGPNYGLQGGSVWAIGASGTLTIASGGSINVESGGVINVASGGSIVNGGEQAFTGNLNIASGGSIRVASGGIVDIAAGGSVRSVHGIQATTMTLGGTQGRWAFGTAALTSGLGTVPTGLSRVVAAQGAGILGEAPNIGSVHWVLVDLSLSSAGSVIFRAGSANGQFTANATISWMAFGT